MDAKTAVDWSEFKVTGAERAKFLSDWHVYRSLNMRRLKEGVLRLKRQHAFETRPVDKPFTDDDSDIPVITLPKLNFLRHMFNECYPDDVVTHNQVFSRAYWIAGERTTCGVTYITNILRSNMNARKAKRQARVPRSTEVDFDGNETKLGLQKFCDKHCLLDAAEFYTSVALSRDGGTTPLGCVITVPKSFLTADVHKEVVPTKVDISQTAECLLIWCPDMLKLWLAEALHGALDPPLPPNPSPFATTWGKITYYFLCVCQTCWSDMWPRFNRTKATLALATERPTGVTVDDSPESILFEETMDLEKLDQDVVEAMNQKWDEISKEMEVESDQKTE